MKKKVMELIKKKEERKAELGTRAQVTEDVTELRSINTEVETLNGEIAELRSILASIPEEDPTTQTPPQAGAGIEERTAAVNGVIPGIVTANTAGEEQRTKEAQDIENRKKEMMTSEKRGMALKENRAVTVGMSDIVLPVHTASDIRPTFNEVSSLLDRVNIKPLQGGESFSQPYIKGYGTGDYTEEGQDYAAAEPVFGYAEINKCKITAYAEDTEELQKLPAADYDAEVMRGISIASRKKITREILVGTGGSNRLVGIFSDKATAIDPLTDLSIGAIDNNTLDEIIFSFGGDEDVEDPAVLILNKNDLKAFSKLRTEDGKKFHNIVTNGNTGTIDGIPFIINSACKAISAETTAVGEYCMAYGPLSNYMLCVFSDMEIKRSEDYKFKQGMIAHRGSVFLGGNVVSQNGFLRIKKGEAIPEA